MPSKELSTVGDIFQLLRRVHIHPGYFVVPVLLSIGAAAFDGIGMGLLIPLLQGFLTMDFSFVKDTPGLHTVLAFLPEAITATDRSLFLFLIGVFVIAMLLRNILKYGSILSLSFVAFRALHHLRTLLFGRYLTFGKLYFDRTNIGHHSTLLSQFTELAFRPLLTINKYIHAVLSLAVYFIVMATISWRLTLFTMPLFLVLHYAVKHLIARMRRLSRSIAEKAAELGKKAVEILSTVPLVQSYSTEDDERAQYKHLSDRATTYTFRMTAIRELTLPLQEAIALFAILILFSAMLAVMVREGRSMAPSFIVYFYLILNATTKFGAMTGFRNSLAEASGPVQEVMDLLHDDGKYRVPSGPKECTGLKSNIALRKLSFSYPDGRDVLSHLSFTIERGTMVAIVGPTGTGKTTIINLLMRYYDCPPETIFVDGVDIREYSVPSLRRHIALVSQETLLLHDSLQQNITYGLRGITGEQLRNAVRRARLAELIEALPHGLETLIGDRGVKLSGGEKQRVSIARALLKNASILILDEATSSLDSKTEKLVQAAMDDAMEGKTAIVIAHRLSTIQHADKIVVIDGGRCLEEGKLAELLERKGKFFELWEEQKFS